ncbi:UNVERIFIED_CONTAM: hypothetical protein PYX00_001359 [Menopon gallinae]|uniref:Uncharacterized protein n=1 Tax=Menopon gallinae TaxID=328185 RepID=A0AAW2IDL9_9NEOP
MMKSNIINNGQMPLHIEERSPYEFLDFTTQYWINDIKLRWAAWKKSSLVSSVLFNYFKSSASPYEAALKAMLNSGDFYTSKQSSLSYHIMEQFLAWKQMYPHNMPPLTIDLKLNAFRLVIKQKNNGLYKLVAEAFEMGADKDRFTNEIHSLVERKSYKEACQMAIVLELYDHFEVDEFVIPLIFQDKFAIAKDFLDGSQRVQLLTAQYLDNILGEKNTRVEIDRIIRQLDIFDPKKDKMTGKPLAKLLKRIMTLYNIPETTCPNLRRKRGSGALQFLIRKRFIEKSIGEESWAEMVEESVGDDFNLQMELVAGVALYGDRASAIRWADKYQIPKHLRPYKIQSHRYFWNDTESASVGAGNSVEPFLYLMILKLGMNQIFIFSGIVLNSKIRDRLHFSVQISFVRNSSIKT